MLEEREDILLGLGNAGGSKAAEVVQTEGDIWRSVQDVVAPVAVLVEALVEDTARVIVGHRCPVGHVVLDLLLHGEGSVLDFTEFDMELAAPDPLAKGLGLHLGELELVFLTTVDVLELGWIDPIEAVGNQDALGRDDGRMELGRSHPGRGPIDDDPAGQSPFSLRR